MTNSSGEELEGLTLKVYLHAVKKGKPVGPRDVMKGANLSSPSVAYRHLQKLEDMGYMQKNPYGEYILKGKAKIPGLIWLGHRLIPKMYIYSVIFLAVLIAELAILAGHWAVEKYEFKVFIALLTIITGSALAVFSVEGYLQSRRRSRNIAAAE